MSLETEALDLYPIQAVHIGARQLHIESYRPSLTTLEFEDADYEISVGHSEYDAEEKLIQIAARIEVGKAEGGTETKGEEKKKSQKLPFHLIVEVIGLFKVNDVVFPADKIYDWASGNAMFILYPFLREHVFALTARAGFVPMLLPLIQVPTFKIAGTKESMRPLKPKRAALANTSKPKRKPRR
jgi:hypothetical protein